MSTVETKVTRLATAAARHIIEPDDELPGAVGDGQVLPDELLALTGLDGGLPLTAGQRSVLSREAIASIAEAGIRFEAVLEAGFAAQVATAADVTDPRLTFILHEMGEETRHQRLFQRLIVQLAPAARFPLPQRVIAIGYRTVIHATVRHRAFLYTLVLAGEEIPDLFQKIAGEHPDTDPFVRAINRYHRQEEARHLSFARAVFHEVWAEASPVDRFLVRHVAPRMISDMFATMVHPGVYGLLGFRAGPTWRAVTRRPQQVQGRRQATRGVLRVLLDAHAFPGDRVPQVWRELCGVDADGAPLADVAAPWDSASFARPSTPTPACPTS